MPLIITIRNVQEGFHNDFRGLQKIHHVAVSMGYQVVYSAASLNAEFRGPKSKEQSFPFSPTKNSLSVSESVRIYLKVEAHNLINGWIPQVSLAMRGCRRSSIATRSLAHRQQDGVNGKCHTSIFGLWDFAVDNPRTSTRLDNTWHYVAQTLHFHHTILQYTTLRTCTRD